MSTRSIQALLGVLLLSTAAAVAQEQPTGPPPVLAIGQEEIKPGSMGAHEKQIASYLALFNRANVRGSRLGLVREHIASPGESSGVGGILFVAPLHEHHADVERKGGDQEEREQTTREEDEDLTALAGAASC